MGSKTTTPLRSETSLLIPSNASLLYPFPNTDSFLLSFFFFLNIFSIPYSAPLSIHGNGRNNRNRPPFFSFSLIFFFNHLFFEHGLTCLYTPCISFFPLAKTGYGNFSFIKNDALSPDWFSHFPKYHHLIPIHVLLTPMTPKQWTVHVGIVKCPTEIGILLTIKSIL